VTFAGICRNLRAFSVQRSAISFWPGVIFFLLVGGIFFTPGAAVVRPAIKKSANARKRPQTVAAGEGKTRTVRNPWQTSSILAHRSLWGVELIG
jgi:hypothetical protein